MKKKIYKTKVNVTIFSENPIKNSMTLADLYSEMLDGDFTGSVDWNMSKQITGKNAAKAIKSVGSSPEFFQMDEEGNEIE